MSDCLYGMHKLRVLSGDTIAILGVGFMGLCFVQLARLWPFARSAEDCALLQELFTRFGANMATTCMAELQDYSERMLRRADAVDVENMIKDALSASGHGFLYRIMKKHQANAPQEWSDHTKTGTHINFGM